MIKVSCVYLRACLELPKTKQKLVNLGSGRKPFAECSHSSLHVVCRLLIQLAPKTFIAQVPPTVMPMLNMHESDPKNRVIGRSLEDETIRESP